VSRAGQRARRDGVPPPCPVISSSAPSRTASQSPLADAGAKACQGVITTNAEDGVTWVHSYVTSDRKRTYCIYDAPAPEAIRRVADRNKLPVDRITEVRVLDPYFYR
jgi:uncharacterized protein DUF4242